MTLYSIPTIYLGGTFACIGTPLAPMSSENFFHYINNHLISENIVLSELDNFKAIDSSQITTQEIQQLYHCISKHAKQHKHILIIQGTDTASYVTAFFHYVCQLLQVNLIFLVSMQPLFASTKQNNTSVNSNSDAYSNLQACIQFIQQDENKDTSYGVWLTDNGNIIHAENIIKSYRNHAPAFTQLSDSKLPNITISELPNINNKGSLQSFNIENISSIKISSFYSLPNSLHHNEAQLASLIQENPDAIILMGYGTGNFLFSEGMQDLLNTAIQKHILLVLTSQVPFGSVDSSYQAGSWLQASSVLSGENLGIPALFAKILVVCTVCSQFHDRLRLWSSLT